MALSDLKIKEYLDKGYKLVDPLDPACIQPASIDLHIDDWIRVPRLDVPEDFVVDPRSTLPIECFRDVDMRGHPGHCYDIPPDGIALASTAERIVIPYGLEGVIDGVSSIGRWFVQVHMTAGYFDTEFQGDGVLEIKNNLPWWFRLSCNLRICQLRYSRIEGEIARPYGKAGNHYQNQRGPIGSQLAGEDKW